MQHAVFALFHNHEQARLAVTEVLDKDSDLHDHVSVIVHEDADTPAHLAEVVFACLLKPKSTAQISVPLPPRK